ncbi:MAG: hypothetical protein H6673_06550 [Anaerolineales bacterium]|nr:hypothetical protein [Anaerolineales bacterium]
MSVYFCVQFFGFTTEDWLQIDDFAGILDEFSSGQVYMFHSSKDIMNNPNIEYLVNQEKLILYSQSLVSFLKQGEDFVQLAEEHRDEVYGHRVNVASRAVSVPLSLRNQVSRSAIIIDESTFSAFSVLSDDSLYSEFRNFLARSSERPVWSGYPRGFAFQRDFEKELEEKVKSSLTQKQLEEEPIILHGQSGIGKTIALASLIFKMQQQFRQYPILFIERRPIKPNYHDIAAFVTWAEQQGASASLIVWDGMLNYDQYLDLVLYLTGHGQKITLVGSSYRQHKGHTTKLKSGKRSMPHDSHWVEAEAILTSQEKMRFEKWITQFVPNISGIKPLLDQYGANFFVALYRLLPSSRSKLMEGINLETIYTEEQIKQIAEEIVTSQGYEVFTSPLAYALLNAGLVDSMSVFSTDKSEIAGEFLDQVQRLIGLIMVPGRFGLRTPIDLLLRALRNETQVDLVDLLEKVDLFTWSTDEIGNISVGPRHALEAELVAKIRLGGPQYEIDFISHLVKNIIVNDMEIQFVLDLIRKINPPDEDPTWNPYGPYLLRLADALAYLREQRSIFNPRLMLQETNLLREAAKISSDNTELTPQNLLERAENVVNNALDFADRENSSNQDLRSQLLVELAATLGAKAKQLYSLDANFATQLYFYLKQRLFEAQAASRDNFYPLDVFFWTTQDLIKASAVDLTIKLDAQAEIYNVFEMAQLEETFANQERVVNP